MRLKPISGPEKAEILNSILVHVLLQENAVVAVLGTKVLLRRAARRPQIFLVL